MTNLQLWAPAEYWLLSAEEKANYFCGPGRGIVETLVPDVWRIGFPLVKPLVITPSCSIHDFCYQWGPDTIEWKWTSDRGFRNNLIRQVEYAASQYSRLYYPITRIRMFYTQRYYKAVRIFGGPAFWKGRNKCTELGSVS